MQLLIRDVTNEDSFSINEIIKFAGSSGPLPIIQITPISIQTKLCLGIIIIGDHSEGEIISFLDPGSDETIHKMPVASRMPQVMKMLGCFPSASQASKNGWNRDIPAGFSEHAIKTGKVRGVIHILNLHSA